MNPTPDWPGTYEEAFLAEIAAHPKDDAYRLIYSDWLENHGRPELAEFIRTQVTLMANSDGKGDLPATAIARLEARERVLLARHGNEWLAPLRNLGARGRVHGEFSRGFVEDVVIDAARFLDGGKDLWSISPVVTLHLNNADPLVAELRDSPLLGRVHGLSFEGAKSISPKGLRTLLGSPHLSRLRALSFWEVALSDEDLLALAALPMLPKLTRLALNNAPCTGAGLPPLLRRFDSLEELRLGFLPNFEPERYAEILAALNPSQVRLLSAYNLRIGNEGMQALASDRRFTGLTELWLLWCGFDHEAMASLASADYLRRVEVVYILDAIGDAGATALASWPGLRTVHTLDLDGCGIGPAGAEALARSPHLKALRKLNLRGSQITDAGLIALAGASWFPSLYEFNAPGNGITADGVNALVAAPTAALRHLDLRGNALGDEGASVLADAPQLRQLRWLTLGDNGISQTVSRRIVATLPDLNVFHAEGGFLTGENLNSLREALSTGDSLEAVNAATEARIVQTLLDDPNDAKARQNYATFLQDIDSPWWIPLRLFDPEQHILPESVENWRQGWTANRDHWLTPLRPWVEPVSDADFDRGLLRTVRFRGNLPDDAATTLATFPPLALLPLEAQAGNMTGAGAFQILARRACLASMTHLAFRAITPDELAILLASPHLASLRSLDLHGNQNLGPEVVRLLLATPCFAALISLDLRSTGMTDAAARALAEHPALALRTLRLGGRDTYTPATIEVLQRRFGQRAVVVEIS